MKITNTGYHLTTTQRRNIKAALTECINRGYNKIGGEMTLQVNTMQITLNFDDKTGLVKQQSELIYSKYTQRSPFAFEY